MFSPKWIKWDPRAALVGMRVLSLEERGAYITVLDLMYCRGGRLEDDDAAIAHELGTDVRIWRRIRKRLIDLGKLSTDWQFLTNDRAAQEYAASQHRHLSSKELADRRWLKYKIEPKLFNHLLNAKAPAKAYANQIKKERDNSDSEISPTQNGHTLNEGDFGSSAGSLATAPVTARVARLPHAETNDKPIVASAELAALIQRKWNDD